MYILIISGPGCSRGCCGPHKITYCLDKLEDAYTKIRAIEKEYSEDGDYCGRSTKYKIYQSTLVEEGKFNLVYLGTQDN